MWESEKELLEELQNLKKDNEEKNNSNFKKDNEKKNVRIVRTTEDKVVVKFWWILLTLFNKFFFRILVLLSFFVLIKIDIVRDFIQTYYFLHYLFLLFFLLIWLEITYGIFMFLNDLSDVINKNVYLHTVTKEKYVESNNDK